MSSYSAGWTQTDIPDLAGRRVLITGGAGGLGLATGRALAAHGANVILADVDPRRGGRAVDEIRRSVANARVDFRLLDLADLEFVRKFTRSINDEAAPLDLLINIAGIYPPPRRAVTRDGFELTTAINHLGHFALTGLLLESLLKSPASRVVSISSVVQAAGRIDFGDLQAEGKYAPYRVYSQSKLACLMFGLELQQRARAANSALQSIIAHPGIARTQIGRERKGTRRGLRDRLEDAAQAMAMRLLGQPAEQGALPLLYAATAPDAVGGAFYGPGGFGQFAGYPTQVKPSARARDIDLRQRLWHVSKELTGVSYDALTKAGQS